MEYKTDILLEGLKFPEGPRWHENKLWFSDMEGFKVMTLDINGASEIILTMKYSPSGLGWLPNGDLLIVSMQNKKLMRLEREGLVEVADLSNLASYHCNDMVTDKNGNSYIGNFGFDINKRPAKIKPAELILVTPDGKTKVVAKNMMFPNGTVITPDGRVLIVGETYAQRLTAFTIESDGSLSDRRVWAQLQANIFPDGICLDEEGAIWVASPSSSEVIRVLKGGEVTDRVKVSDQNSAYACMLGGNDRKTLFVCTSNPDHTRGRIEYVKTKMNVAGAGLP